MTIEEFFEFDETAYRERIRPLSDDDLERCKQKTVRVITTSSCGSFAGGFLAIPTWGASLAGIAISWRRMTVAFLKQELIKEERERRQLARFRTRTRDILLPTVISAATMGIGAGVDHVLTAGGAEAIQHVASHSASHLASNLTHEASASAHHLAVPDPAGGVHAAAHGFRDGMEQASEVLTHPGTEFLVPPGADNYTSAYVLGEAAAIEVSKKAAEELTERANELAEEGFGKRAPDPE